MIAASSFTILGNKLCKAAFGGVGCLDSPCITQNARLYLTETTRLFTQLWASLQSGEADGGVD